MNLLPLNLQTEYLTELKFSNYNKNNSNRISTLSNSKTTTTTISSQNALGRLSNLNLFNNKNISSSHKQIHVEKFSRSRSDYDSSIDLRSNVDSKLSGKSSSLNTTIEVARRGDSTRSIMSSNERRKLNQNNLEDKLLTIARKDLDRQLNYSQLLLKREKTMLLDQFMETKAANIELHAKNKKEKEMNLEREHSHLHFSNRVIRTAINVSHSADSGTVFRTVEVEPGKQNVNVFDKFIEQKRKYFPSYLKQTNRVKYSLPIYELDKVIDKVRKANETNRKICTKYKNHRIAEQRAQNYMSNKYIFKEFPEFINIINPLPQIKPEEQNHTRQPHFVSLHHLHHQHDDLHHSHDNESVSELNHSHRHGDNSNHQDHVNLPPINVNNVS